MIFLYNTFTIYKDITKNPGNCIFIIIIKHFDTIVLYKYVYIQIKSIDIESYQLLLPKRIIFTSERLHTYYYKVYNRQNCSHVLLVSAVHKH